MALGIGRWTPAVGRWGLVVALAVSALPGSSAALASEAEPSATVARDLADFDFATQAVARNYSGWPAKTSGGRGAQLDSLTASLRERLARGEGGEEALRAAVDAWLAWFDDGHLQARWPDPETGQAGWPAHEFSLERIDDSTLYLRLPSFSDRYVDTVRDLIDENAQALVSTPNLVVDVRNNGGGSDFVYGPVLPWLHSGPITRLGVEIRVSEDNRRLRAEIADLLESSSPEAARVLRSESHRMQGHPGGFITREPAREVVDLGPPSANPTRVAILVDNAASSAENFLLDARQSRKVVLMGQAPSAGVIDHGEMMSMPAPSGRFELAWATTRSLRLPDDPVDPHGIAPQVVIPAKVADPVAWAADWLRGQAAPR